MKEIELATWDRKRQYELFRSFAFPHFSLTVRLDITDFIALAKSEKLSTFNAVLFAVMKTTNNIAEFRTRFAGNQIFEYDVIQPSYTVPIANNHFAFCETEYSKDWKIFDERCRKSTKEGKAQVELSDCTADSLDWIYISCAPWLDFTSGTHPVADADDCIPRIAWGKITQAAERWHMPVNLQVHHALMDGFHAGKFYENLEMELQSFGVLNINS